MLPLRSESFDRLISQVQSCELCPSMRVRVFFTGALEIDRLIGVEAVVGEIKPGMLAGDDQRRNEPTRCQRVRYGSEFDGFWSGADDQPDVGRTQPSP